jgi:SAM-dependent methyltransferase
MHDDAQALKFPSDSFDYIVSCECMEHVLNPRKMTKEIARVLRPGGKFCLSTPSYVNGVLLAWASWISGKPYDSGAGVQPHENFYFFGISKLICMTPGRRSTRPIAVVISGFYSRGSIRLTHAAVFVQMGSHRR